MSKESILDLFFNDVLPSIARGDLAVEATVYNIHFNTAINRNETMKYIDNIHNDNLPTLTIKDVELFSHLLLSFIDEVGSRNIKWCTPDVYNASIEVRIKYFLALVWSNMTAGDFIEPENFLRRSISFVKDETFKDLTITSNPISILNNSCLEVSNVEEKAYHDETPYALRVSITDLENHRMVLPDIKYGIDNIGDEKTAYIYAIQYDNKLKKENGDESKFCLKINRLLYKVDQDIPKEELDKKMETQGDEMDIDENIVDVSPSSLVSLTVALSLFASKGVTKILIPSYLPIRWGAKSIMHERKLAFYQRKGYSEEQLATLKAEYEEEQLRIQRNITDKLIRSLRRIDYHFDGIDISAYPGDVDDFMHLKMYSNFQAYNSEHILGQISSAVNGDEIGYKTK